jgi:hypothetical protein
VSRQFELLDATVKEIRAQGGVVTATIQNGHTKIYWEIGDKRIMQVISTSPSGVDAIRQARAQVRRLARGG